MDANIALLKRLYLASLGIIESEPEMPSHESNETAFVGAMRDAHIALAAAGVRVPQLNEN